MSARLIEIQQANTEILGRFASDLNVTNHGKPPSVEWLKRVPSPGCVSWESHKNQPSQMTEEGRIVNWGQIIAGIDADNILSALALLVSVVVGFVAYFQTHNANEAAKDANNHAEEANRIAAESRDAATRANELAGNANQISENANLISQRALSASRDQTVYEWTAEYDAHMPALTIRNQCGLTANDVHVLVRLKDQVIAEGHADSLPPIGQIILDGTLIRQEIVEEGEAGRRANLVDIPGADLRIGIVWTSELGVRRSLESQQRFSDYKEQRDL